MHPNRLLVLSLALVAGGCVRSSDSDNAPPPAPPGLTVSAVAPSGGPPAGGQLVTLTGTAFESGATVVFGGSPALASVLSATSIACTTPAGSGVVGITVTNPGGAVATLGSAYTYTGAPVVQAVTPTTGDVSGGTPVTVSGANFVAGVTVDFGGTLATNISVASATTLLATTPAGSAGAVSVTVTDPGAQSGVLANGFTYTTGGTAAVINSVAPSFGPSAGGTTITVGGSGFQSGATVTVGGVAATAVTITGSQITAVTPAAAFGASGAQPVTVTNPGAASTTNTSPGFTYTIAGVAPSTGAAADPDVADDAWSALHVVWQRTAAGGGTDILYARSTDGGRTFSATPTNLSSSTNVSARPRVAASGLSVYVVWNETVGSTQHVYGAYSLDSGQTFTSAASLASTTGVTPDPDVAFGSSGQAMIAHRFNGGTAPSGGQQVHVAAIQGWIRTIDGGGPIYYSTTVQNGAVAAGAPAVAADSTNVWVAYGAANLGGGPVPQYGNVDLWVARSTDSGGTFASPQTLLNDGNDRYAPAIAARGSALVVSHLMFGPAPQGGTQTRTFVQWSSDAGANWSGAVGLGTVVATPGSPPFFQALTTLDVPSVGVDGQGTFYAAWSEYAAGTSNADVFVSWSTDGGKTWVSPSTPANVSNNAGASRTPQVAGQSGTGAWAVFADDTASTGTPDVLLR